MNNTILTLNRNGLQVIGDNNSFSNVTSRFNNGTGIILNGNNNTLNGSLLQNNTNGLTITGNENQVNSTLIFNNTNGSTINGDNNNLTGNNVHNNTENGLIINGSNNTFVQNNITGNNNAILVENGTNNTLNYNRVAGNTHNLHNNKKGTVNAEYNWWGQNTPTCITGMNINTGNHVVAVLNVPSGTINPGQIYNITVTLKSSTGEELKMEIPSFLVQFFINNGGDVYPETAPLINNSAWTQFVVFNPGTYTLTTTIDQQTLTNVLSTPVNSQPVTTNKIPRKPADPTPNNNLCGAMAVGNLLNSLGAKADANLISQIGGLTSQGISMHGLSQAASYYGIQLTGLKVDSGQLKPNDIVLLNINGNNHYTLILGKLGNNYIIQDPFLGTVVMTTEQFNKYYTGNALTTNPNGRGTLLSVDEMKGLFGGVGEVEVATGIGTGLMGVGAGFSWTGVGLILLAVGAVIVAGVAIYKANEHYSQKYPELNKPLPSYAPFGYKLSMGIALDVAHWLDGPAKGWTTRQVKQYKEDVEFLKNIGSGGGGGKIPKIIEEVAKVARNIPEMSLPYKIAAYLLIGSLPTYYMLKNIPKPKIFEGIAKPVVKVMGNILDIAVNAVNKTIGKLKPIKVPKGLGAGASGKLKPVKISKSSAKMVKAVANAGIKFVKSFSNAFRR